jgi:3-hydroxymyristoyl/3-hydroxydecanoyl-(acyl carrier protein) dehydratase
MYPPPERRQPDEARSPGVVLDYTDLREFAEGKIANVFGAEYAPIDTYHRRARLPMEPFLFVSRVLNMDAERGNLRPCSIVTEYDIPKDAWYITGGQTPWPIIVEASHCDLLLMGYLGIDFESKGDRVFRVVEATMTFTDTPVFAGDTLRMEVKINSFKRMGDALLLFNSYDCYKGDKLIATIRDGCVGFFTDEQVEGGQGVVLTEAEIEERKGIQKKSFDPLLTCDKSRFEQADLLQLTRHNDAGCFGPAYDQGNLNPSLCFANEASLMIDRVVSVDPGGGAWGLGLVVAEKDLAPDHWYFPCHFKDDQVLAGALIGEGCVQVGKFYTLFLGLQTCTQDAVFQILPNRPQKIRCRGQVTPKDTLLTYRMEVKDIGLVPDPYLIADVDVLLGDKVVVKFEDMGGGISPLIEREAGRLPSPTSVQEQTPKAPMAEDRDEDALFTRYHIEEFATGSLVACFGPDFSIYDNRRAPRTPNGDLMLISRVLEVTGKRLDLKNPASVLSEYDVPEEAWFFTENSHPAVPPYSILMEISLQPNGFISAYVGTTLLSPDIDFCFRNLDGEGTILRPIDLRGKTITNRSELLSTVTTKNTIIQRFRFELIHDGLPFYEGTAAFGYFPPSALVNQIGLDGGISNNPLQTKEYLSTSSIVHIDLKSTTAREQYYQKKAERSHYHLAGPQLDFLDEVHIVEKGGKYGQGYICGYKKIDPTDWFYPCHFFQDPVMPGSLGVESILQAMQIYALQQDLGAQFQSPRFAQRLNHNIVWKYRGQLIPDDDQMVIDVHIKKVERSPETVNIVGDANLWKNDIRIYEVTDAAICLEEAPAG